MKNLDMFGTFLERSNTTATAKRGAAPRDSDPLVACLRALATSGAMTPARLLVRAELVRGRRDDLRDRFGSRGRERSLTVST